MSTKKYVCVLAGAAVVVAAVVFGILGCEQNVTHEAGVKPAAGPHTQASPTPKTRQRGPAGPHTEKPTPPPTPPSQ
jgi:hypothetical protein